MLNVYCIGAISVLLSFVLGGCASAAKPTASAPCVKGCVGLVMLGVEQATVGPNALPLALVGDPSEPQPTEPPTSFRAMFAPHPSPPSFKPIEVEVERNPAGPVIGSEGHRQVRFDYVAKVVLDRPGPWNMEVRVRGPWQVEEAVSTVQFRVVDSAAPLPPN